MTDEFDPSRWERIRDIYEQALSLTGQEREACLTGQCGSDLELRLQVERLIRASEKNPGFLETPLELVTWQSDFEPREQRLGPYRLIKRLGSGGMGTVYLGERDDGHFRLRVAIKIAWPDSLISNLPERFARERQILADLDHPNISRLLDGGTTVEGLPYIVMEYIDGKRINTYCEQGDLLLNERLRLFLEVCRAVEYAHEHQVIHRDIKPGNILVTGQGRVKLLDFGIARLLEPDGSDAPAGTAKTGTPLMTFDYASPEQICGERAGAASDIYSLGVVLYELISGQMPYTLSNHSPLTIIRAIAEETPPLITEGGDPGLLRQLNHLLGRAMAKSPEDRYPTVAALAADITAILEGRSIDIREEPPVRRRWLAVARGALLTIALALAGLLAWQQRGGEGAGSPFGADLTALYAAKIARAGMAIDNGDHSLALKTLAEIDADHRGLRDLMGYERDYLMSEASRPRILAQSVAFDTAKVFAHGRSLVTSSSNFRRLDLWDIETRQHLRTAKSDDKRLWTMWHPDGGDSSLLITTRGEDLKVEDFPSGATIGECRLPGKDMVYAFLWKDVYTIESEGTVRRWDVPGCRSVVIAKIRRFPNEEPDHVANLPLIAVYSRDKASFSVWSLVTWRQLIDTAAAGHSQFGVPIASSSYDQKGDLLVLSKPHRSVEVYDLRHGRQIFGHAHNEEINILKLDAGTGRLIEVQDNGKVIIWSLATKSQLRSTNIGGIVCHAEILRQGRYLAITTDQGVLKVLDLQAPDLRPIFSRQIHPPGSKVRLRYEEEQDWLVSAGSDGTVRIWVVNDLLQLQAIQAVPAVQVNSVAISPDGQWIAFGGNDNRIHIRDVATREQERTIEAHRDIVLSVAFSPAGDRLVTSSRDAVVRVWSFADGRILHSLKHDRQIHTVIFSPDGQSIASASGDGGIRIWDARSGRQRLLISHDQDEVYSLAYAMNGQILASGDSRGQVQLWDASTGASLGVAGNLSGAVWALAAAPDGRHVAAVGDDPYIRVFDIVAGIKSYRIDAGLQGALDVAFSPDGRRLAFARKDRTVRIIDTTTHHELLKINGHYDDISSLAFSADGRMLVSGGHDGQVLIHR